MKKLWLLLATIVLVTFALSSVAYAGSYDTVPVVYLGWSLSPNSTVTNYLINTKPLGGLDNSASPYAAPYSATCTITQSILFGGTLSTELSGSINAGTGVVSGGLGGKINTTINIQATYTGTFNENYGPVTVPAYKKLTLNSRIYGTKVNGYAKLFLQFLEIKRGTYTVKIPEYQMFYPVFTS